MKILYLNWKCFNGAETIETFSELGYDVSPFFHPDFKEPKSDAFEASFSSFLEKNSCDFAFSWNYFPVLAEACKNAGIFYISFVYDSPLANLYSYTLAYPTNRIFLFDSAQAEEFRRGGLTNVFFMTLPSNTLRADRLLPQPHETERTRCDVSFIGSLYNEAHDFYSRMDFSKDRYLEGYLNGVMDAQSQIYGVHLLRSAITPEIAKRAYALLPLAPGPLSVEPEGYRLAEYVLGRKLTSRERIGYLSAVGKRFGKKADLKLFTLDPSAEIPGFSNMGIAEYEHEMTHVFADSRINLNITLRSIENGIPLRCMDILSAGGFLLTNYQSDFSPDFIVGEDYDYFDSTDDLLGKIDYYLSHEKIRREIAQNGRAKAQAYFSMKEVLSRVLATAFDQMP